MRAATLADLPLLASLVRAHHESAGFLYEEGPARGCPLLPGDRCPRQRGTAGGAEKRVAWGLALAFVSGIIVCAIVPVIVRSFLH